MPSAPISPTPPPHLAPPPSTPSSHSSTPGEAERPDRLLHFLRAPEPVQEAGPCEHKVRLGPARGGSVQVLHLPLPDDYREREAQGNGAMGPCEHKVHLGPVRGGSIQVLHLPLTDYYGGRRGGDDCREGRGRGRGRGGAGRCKPAEGGAGEQRESRRKEETRRGDAGRHRRPDLHPLRPPSPPPASLSGLQKSSWHTPAKDCACRSAILPAISSAVAAALCGTEGTQRE